MSPLENTDAGIERAAAGSLAAYRSLAKAAGVDLSTVLAHARNNTLKALVAGPVAERRAADAHIARIERLTDLRIRDAALRALASD